MSNLDGIEATIGTAYRYAVGQHWNGEQIIAHIAGALNARTYCAYCGAEFAIDDNAASLVAQHIATCEKHPMYQALNLLSEGIKSGSDGSGDYMASMEAWKDRVRTFFGARQKR